MPIATGDFVRLRIKKGILKGTSIDAACRIKMTIKYGVGIEEEDLSSSKRKKMWRINSFVGEPPPVAAVGSIRDTIRTIIETAASKLVAMQTSPRYECSVC